MANIRVPFLVERKPKAGASSWYWQPSAALARAGWKPLALGKDFAPALKAAQARNAEVATWQAGGARPAQVARRTPAGTLAALIAAYRRDVLDGRKPDGRPRLAPKTRAVYATQLDRLERWAGAQPLAYVTRARVRALRDAALKPPAHGGLGHAAAFNLLKLGRQLFAYAETLEGPLAIPAGANPFARFELAAPRPRARVWELDDDAAFDAAAYELGLPGLALARALALYTAQREADLLRLTEAQLGPIEILDPHVRRIFAAPGAPVEGWIFVQGKSLNRDVPTAMEIAFEPALLARVKAAIRANRARDRAAHPPRLLTHVLVDDRPGPNCGRRWSERAFIRAWRAVLDHAATRTGRDHMRALVWHDLRRTRVVRLRRKGMDPAMIATITGHKPRSIEMMLEVYGPIDHQMTSGALAAALAGESAQREEKTA